MAANKKLVSALKKVVAAGWELEWSNDYANEGGISTTDQLIEVWKPREDQFIVEDGSTFIAVVSGPKPEWEKDFWSSNRDGDSDFAQWFQNEIQKSILGFVTKNLVISKWKIFS